MKSFGRLVLIPWETFGGTGKPDLVWMVPSTDILVVLTVVS